jgi:hypothetical protein
MNYLARSYQDKYGKMMGLVRIAGYPLLLLLQMIRIVPQVLWKCRVLAEGKWSEYGPQFNGVGAVNNLAYSTLAINFDRFGRSGVSPILGLGNFPLHGFFYHNLLPLYVYWRSGPIVPLVGMFGWLLAHFCWLNAAPASNVLLLVALLLFSTTFYFVTFGDVNYNALGWAFLPLFLFATLNKLYALSMVLCLVMSLFSTTAIVISSFAALSMVLEIGSVMPLLILGPAIVKVLCNVLPLVRSDGFFETIKKTGKLKGYCNDDVKYRRERSGSKFLQVPPNQFYCLLILYVQNFACITLMSGHVPLLVCIGIALYVANSSKFCFMDNESIMLVQLTFAFPYMVQLEGILPLISFWLLVSPLPYFLAFSRSDPSVDYIPVYGPVNIKRMLTDMEDFLRDVLPGERIMVAFNDPQGCYHKIFDGFRHEHELGLFVSARKNVHMMPDWFAVLETNYSDAPSIWGRDVADVVTNMNFWKAEYAVIYQEAGSALQRVWNENGFEEVSRFSWPKYHSDLNNEGFIK